MEELEYNEEEAIRFILDRMPADLTAKIKKEGIEYILDLIYDFYDEKGYLDGDEDDDETIDIDESEMIDYIMERIVADNKSAQFSDIIIQTILDEEYEYCKSIGVFKDETK